MTAESQGWWTDEPDESITAPDPDAGIHRMGHRDPANGNPISGGPTGASPWPTPEHVDGEPVHPGRLALGMAVLVAERIRAGKPAGTAFVTGVGLVMRTATDAGTLARRVLGPPIRAAEITAAFAAMLPGVDVPRRSLARSRAALGRMGDQARRRGQAAVTAGRADASEFLQSSVADSVAWAQTKVVPQIVDGLVPHLVDAVVPRLIEGAMPEIRTRVLPIVIEDLTKDPQVRELVVEQGRGVVGEAAQQLRATTAQRRRPAGNGISPVGTQPHRVRRVAGPSSICATGLAGVGANQSANQSPPSSAPQSAPDGG